MKQFFTSLSLIFNLFLFSSQLFGDIIPPNHHVVHRCVKIANLQEFPKIKVVGFVTGPTTEGYEAYEVKGNECLHQGYKFNQLSLFWLTSDHFKNTDLTKIEVEANRIKDPRFNFLSKIEDSQETTVPDRDRTTEETFIYNLKRSSGQGLKLKLIKHIRK